MRFHPMPIRGPGGDGKVRPLPRVIRSPGETGRMFLHPMPRQEPGKGPVKERPFVDGIIYRPGVEPWRDQPSDGSSNDPVSGGPVFDVPGLGKAYPFPGYVTDPGTGAAQPPEFDPGFGPTPVSNMQDLIDQIAAAMANNQITGEAAQTLIATVETYKPAVQNMGVLTSVDAETFTGDGSNQFAVQNTDPRAGANALRPDSAKLDSPLRSDEASDEEDRGGDRHATIAGQRNAPPHYSPHGTDPKSPPKYDLKDWPGEPWDDRRAAFFKDGVKRKLSSRWGWRYRPNNPKDFHAGIDIAAGVGSEVSSIDGGMVVCPDKDADAAKKFQCRDDAVVIYDKERGVFYTYLHIVPGVNINAGDTIEPGMKVGEIAGDGPPHLHYARHKSATPDLGNRTDKNSIDPLP